MLASLPLDPLPVPSHSPDEARRVVDDVLADPRYRVPEPSLLDRIMKWFEDRLGDLVGTLFDTGAGSLFAWLIIGTALTVTIVLLLRATGSVRRDRAPSIATMVELTRTPAEWRDEAAELEAQGRWKEAMRCRYRALVGELVALGHIPELPGRTAGEYRRDVAERDPAAATAFSDASDLFELAWYGDLPTGADERDRFVRLEADILGLVRA